MVNAWSLAASILSGTFDKDYPMKKDKDKELDDSGITIENIDGVKSVYVGSGNTADLQFNDGLDYEDMYIGMESAGSIDLADVDDQYAHHFSFPSYADMTPDEANLHINANSAYNDGWTQQAYKDMIMEKREPKRNHQYKYHETEIMDDIEEYVSSTYNGHYTGTEHEFRNVQTIDLMAARDIASGFCQANILKYASRYGSKEGRNKKDLLKVIHYAMLLLHFDGHYGKPSISDGTFDQMP
tara:strand:+ start:882 stop:1604 length:723 start_codon:yes stop_codon:yes gene_type:complete